MPPDPPSRHARLCMRERAFARYYHPTTTMFPPPTQNPVLNPVVHTVSTKNIMMEGMAVKLYTYSIDSTERDILSVLIHYRYLLGQSKAGYPP